VAAEVSGYPYVDISDITDLALRKQEDLFILVLDVLQNPQNLGTLLRTAEAAGVHGVLIPQHRAAEVTPAVVSASAGASELLLVAQANIARALAELKEAGVWVVGLDGGDRSQSIQTIPLNGPIALVVGNEGEGMRQLVRETCDFVAALPMKGDIESLNAAVAGSIAIYMTYFAREQKKIATNK